MTMPKLNSREMKRLEEIAGNEAWLAGWKLCRKTNESLRDKGLIREILTTIRGSRAEITDLGSQVLAGFPKEVAHDDRR